MEIVKRYIENLNHFLEKYTDLSENDIIRPMSYSLFAPCKRLRPLIMIAFYELCGGQSDEIYKFAVALEMIHTFSLIHDDLPCMDNDDIRRGKKCNHKEFGEDVALLTGDALLTKAFKVVSETKELNSKNVLKCINILSEETLKMIFGQYNELKNKGDILEIYRLKTASLFISAAKIGTVLAGANENDVLLAEEFAKKFGICFQMIDDVKDKDLYLNDIIDNNNVLNQIKSLTHECFHILKKFKNKSLVLEYILDLICSQISY